MSLKNILLAGAAISSLAIISEFSKPKHETLIGVYEGYHTRSDRKILIYVDGEYYISKNIEVKKLMDGTTYSFDLMTPTNSDKYLTNPKPVIDAENFPKNLI